jgi:hypothetical protein
MTKIAGSGSGSISQKHETADPDPDPPQNFMDPQHWLKPQVLEKNHPRDRRETNTVINLLTSVVDQNPIRRIRMFLGLPDPSLFVRIRILSVWYHAKSKKSLISTVS